MNKNKIIFAISLLVVAWVFHTYLITQGYTNYVYERFRDIAINVLVLVVAYYNLRYVFKDKQNALFYFIMANLFYMIFATHFLRLIFGGLTC